MLSIGSADFKGFLAGEPKQYMVNPFEYFAGRLTTVPPVQLSNSLLLLAGKITLFLEDKDLPTHYVETFLETLRKFCVAEVLPAAVNVYWLLQAIEPKHPLLRSAVADWKDEGLWSRLEGLARNHHDALISLLKENPQLASTAQTRQGFYLPPGMVGGQMPVIIGRQEQDRRARAEELMEQGVQAEGMGDFTAARDCYEIATELVPRDREIAFAYAQIFLRLDDPESSARLLGRLCKTAPRSAKFQSAYGSALASVGRIEEALGAFDRALRLEPTRPIAIANKATALNRLNRQLEAATLLLEAFKREPPFAPTSDLVPNVSHSLMSCIAAAIKSSDLGLADELSARLCDVNPYDATSWEFRARVAAQANRPADAITYYAKSLDINPNRASAVHACLSLAQSNEMREEAVRIARRYLAVKPDDGDLWNDLGYLLVSNGDLPNAIECYQKATEYSPADALHWANLGGALLQAGTSVESMSEGLKHLDRAVEMRPDHLPARFNRAAGLLMLGDLRSAEEEFTEILRMSPNFPQAADLLALCRAALTNNSEG